MNLKVTQLLLLSAERYSYFNHHPKAFKNKLHHHHHHY